MATSTYSVSFSAKGRDLFEANNNPLNYPVPPAGMPSGQATALKNAVAAAIVALGPTDSYPTTGHASQLHGVTLNVAASINFGTHAVSVVIS